jgi:hypothetical protein
MNMSMGIESSLYVFGTNKYTIYLLLITLSSDILDKLESKTCSITIGLGI